MKYIIETPRLWLRKFTLEDADFIVQLLNNEGWLKYIGDRNVHTTVDAEKYLQNGPIKSYQLHGYGLWLVEKKEGNLPIGMCGIINRETLHCPDIGFAFLPEFNGKGYAVEAATATLSYAADSLALEEVCAITLAENEKSVRLLTQLGLQHKGPIYFPDSTEELQLFSNKKT